MAELADRQFGVVSRAQLAATGVSSTAIARRLADGRLRLLHAGVYAAGHRHLTPRGRWLGAVLAGGPGAVLSHASAAAAWELRPEPPGPLHITVRRAQGRGQRDLRAHRCRLEPRDVTVLDGIAITTVARTLLDCAETEPQRTVDRALDQAVRIGLYDGEALDDVVARHTGRRGLRRLRRGLARLRPDAGQTRSELERRALELLERHGLPRPEVNAMVLGHEVDLLWRDRRLVVELDGHAFHRTPADLERDHRRDFELETAGYRVLRLTWRQVTGQGASVARALASLLH